jgi:hypothetical protein
MVDLLQDLQYYFFVLHFTRGFPVWLHNIPEIKFRTDNEIFKVWICQLLLFFFALMNPLLNYARPSLSMGDHVAHDDMDHTYGNYKKIVVHHGHGQAYLIISQTQENGLINVEIKVQNLLLFSSRYIPCYCLAIIMNKK